MTGQARPRRDAGFSLPELVVTMLVLSIVLGLLGTLFANVAKYTGAASSSRDAMAQAALAVDEVGAVVRTAADQPTGPTTSKDAIWSDATHPSSALSLWVTAFSDTSATSPQPSLVHFWFQTDRTQPKYGCLVEDRWAVTDPTAAFPDFNGAHTSRCIAGSQNNPFVLTGDPFFSYLDAKAQVIPIGSGALTATQLPLVTFVVVTPVLHKAQGLPGSDLYVLSSAIGMPNVARDVDGTVAVPTVPTDTPSPPASDGPTDDPSADDPSATDDPSASASASDSPSASASDSPSASASSTASSSPSASAAPSASTTPSDTPSASDAPSTSPSPDPTSTP